MQWRKAHYKAKGASINFFHSRLFFLFIIHFIFYLLTVNKRKILSVTLKRHNFPSIWPCVSKISWVSQQPSSFKDLSAGSYTPMSFCAILSLAMGTQQGQEIPWLLGWWPYFNNTLSLWGTWTTPLRISLKSLWHQKTAMQVKLYHVVWACLIVDTLKVSPPRVHVSNAVNSR